MSSPYTSSSGLRSSCGAPRSSCPALHPSRGPSWTSCRRGSCKRHIKVIIQKGSTQEQRFELRAAAARTVSRAILFCSPAQKWLRPSELSPNQPSNKDLVITAAPALNAWLQGGASQPSGMIYSDLCPLFIVSCSLCGPFTPSLETPPGPHSASLGFIPPLRVL